MTWLHKPRLVAAAERQHALAINARYKLEKAGIRAKTHDIRDASGARYDPVNLLVMGGVRVMVRPLGWIAAPWSADERLAAEGVWVQCGTADATLAPLIERCRQLLQNPWATYQQCGRIILLKR